MKRPGRDVVVPFREVLHDVDDEGHLDVPDSGAAYLGKGDITLLPITPQEKARIRRQRARRFPFGFGVRP